MKKIICVLLISALCFSLCACKKETETIEITTENWQEYFCLEQYEVWQKNENDDYNNLKIEIAMWLKDEYIDRFVKNQNTTVTIDFNCETVMKGVTIDFATQTYTVEDIARPNPYSNYMPADGKSPVTLKGVSYSTMEFVAPVFLTVGDCDPLPDGNIHYIMVNENPVLSHIEGKMILYTKD